MARLLAWKTEKTNLAARVDFVRSGVGKLSADDREATGQRVSAAETATLCFVPAKDPAFIYCQF